MLRRNVRMPRGVKHMTGASKPCTREAAYSVSKEGEMELHDSHLGYLREGPPLKRARRDEDGAGRSEASVEPSNPEGSNMVAEMEEDLWPFADLDEDEDVSGKEKGGTVPRAGYKKVRRSYARAVRMVADWKQSIPSTRIAQFKPHFEDIVSDMLWREGGGDSMGTCSQKGCGSVATTRCRECRGREPMCIPCSVTAHRNLPFHWLSVWNGNYFERRDLAELGFVIRLGHHGDGCAHIPCNAQPLKFVIVHENGVHNCLLEYCHCPGRRNELSQLVRSDLFPATLERTETAFTCDVLERFHLDYDISKRSSQDFVRILEGLSTGDRLTGLVKVSARFAADRSPG